MYGLLSIQLYLTSGGNSPIRSQALHMLYRFDRPLGSTGGCPVPIAKLKNRRVPLEPFHRSPY